MVDAFRDVLKILNIDLKPSNARLMSWPDRYEEVLYAGAHIATGEDGPGNEYHHGIVLDNREQMTMVHFWGPDKRTARIRTTTLACFLAGSSELVGKVSRPLYLISYDNDDEQKRRKTIERAEQLLKEADKVIYDLVTANCECLTAYCRTGTWISKQVQKAINGLIEKITPMLRATLKYSSRGFASTRTSFPS